MRTGPMADGTDAIVIEHLTKKFVIKHQAGSLKRAILDVARRKEVEVFTALNDVSFRVPHGQTVAVVGRNGSGKSTLLSILARVYLPTTGTVGLFGQNGGKARIAPLLELGAGFHPDLTGIDNILFYGAVLGLNAKQMQAKLESIIDFAELDKKVDTLVRNWNDGAKLRLGFSVAVHTEPDILLVDEVLAVGDEAFQTKCYRVIAEMQEQGKTILFVSHDLKTVERVAERVIWLHNGVVREDGDMPTVLQNYRDASLVPTR